MLLLSSGWKTGMLLNILKLQDSLWAIHVQRTIGSKISAVEKPRFRT